MIKYLGSKRRLVPRIVDIVGQLEGVETVCDLFSGTSRVGQALKRAGYRVHANDWMTYAYHLAATYVALDAEEFPPERVRPVLDRLNALAGTPGYVTQKFAIEAHYFQPANAARVDAIRDQIEHEDPALRSLLLTSLMVAADRVDSTTGLQMAYLKQWASRSFNALEMTMPELLPGPGLATQRDAIELAAELECDLVYLDPPYNQHSYLGNYHIWESLVRDDQPETYGIANKRIDVRTQKSPFNLKSSAREAMAELVGSLRTRYLVLSFNDEGYVSREEIEEILGRWGTYTCESVAYPRYVGAQIGVYNLKGVKVGQPGALTNHEFLFTARRAGG